MARQNPEKPLGTVLVISQVYVPDPAAVGQYMHDAAAELVRRGYRVVVYAAARGYDDPSRRYPLRETLDGVTVRRLRLSSFGKSSIKSRLAAQMLFLLQATALGLFTRRLDRILVSTSPPMASLAANFLRFLRRVPVVFWAMDINPDQIVAMGQVRENSVPARAFEWINRGILRRAKTVVALDRFMGARLEAKYPVGDRMVIVPPWPQENYVQPVPHEENPFRNKLGVGDKLVVMYSGNISPAHPVTTILEAAARVRDDERIQFVFVGGGNGKKLIEEQISREGLSNVRTLPYQPLDEIRYSLSAADVHLVSMGSEMVGIVHPCKVYGAMAVARPVLLLGPAACHVGELLSAYDCGWQVDHGDIDRAEALLRQIADSPRAPLSIRGERGRAAVLRDLNMESLRGQFCDALTHQ